MPLSSCAPVVKWLLISLGSAQDEAAQRAALPSALLGQESSEAGGAAAVASDFANSAASALPSGESWILPAYNGSRSLFMKAGTMQAVSSRFANPATCKVAAPVATKSP